MTGTNRDSRLPPELQSTLRTVRLSASGVLVVAVAALLLAGAVFLPLALYPPAKESARYAAQFRSEAITTEGEVIEATRRGDKFYITFRYRAGGEEYTLRTTAPRRVANGLQSGSRIPVRYLASAPGDGRVFGRAPGAFPAGLVFLIPSLCVPAAGVLLLVIRKQARLLSEGRVTLATVTGARKLKGRDSPTWRVSYEWRLLTGAVRRGSYDLQRKTTPATGETIPILYDRDDPQRHGRYPLSLVRVAGARTARAPRRAKAAG